MYMFSYFCQNTFLKYTKVASRSAKHIFVFFYERSITQVYLFLF